MCNAKGTHAYLDVVRSVIDSFLDGSTSDLLPTVSNSLNVGDICVFNRSQGQWQIGRVAVFVLFGEN